MDKLAGTNATLWEMETLAGDLLDGSASGLARVGEGVEGRA